MCPNSCARTTRTSPFVNGFFRSVSQTTTLSVGPRPTANAFASFVMSLTFSTSTGVSIPSARSSVWTSWRSTGVDGLWTPPASRYGVTTRKTTASVRKIGVTGSHQLRGERRAKYMTTATWSITNATPPASWAHGATSQSNQEPSVSP